MNGKESGTDPAVPPSSPSPTGWLQLAPVVAPDV